MKIDIPISIGELVDKITILKIKKIKVDNLEKLENINKELNSLQNIIKSLQLNPDSLNPLLKNLYETNLTLWEIEDDIRLLEKDKEFGEKFISLARSVYITNDQRFKIKNEINETFNSEYKEEKSYEDY